MVTVPTVRGAVASEPFVATEVALLCFVAVAAWTTNLPEWVARELSSTTWLVVAPLFALVIVGHAVADLRRSDQPVALPNTPVGALRVLWRATETLVALVLLGVACVVLLSTSTGFNPEAIGGRMALLLAIVYVVSGYAVLLLMGGRVAGTVGYRLVAGGTNRNES